MNEGKVIYRNGKIVTKRFTETSFLLTSIFVVLTGLTLYGFFTIDTKDVNLLEAAKKTLEYFRIMFGSPRAVGSHFGVIENVTFLRVLAKAGELLLVTLSLAFLTTIIGGVLAIVLGLFAAKNLTNFRVSNTIKSLVAIVRAVPTVLWVLIFAIGNGLGSAAAIIGMSFHTVGFLLKSFSESFEEIDYGVIEALKASGASWISIVFQAILPSSITQILSWTFIRFEINFAVAVAMGAAAGAGGIGFNLFMSSAYFFDMREIGYITYLILIVAILMELFATRLRKKFTIDIE